MPALGRTLLVWLSLALGVLALVAAFLLLSRAFRSADGGRAAPEAAPPPEPAPRVAPRPPPREPAVFTNDAAVLDVAVPEPSALDPMRIRDPGSVLIARQLFEGLTKWDPVKKQVVGAAAQSWRVARGGRRFVFKLRPGMRFHNGRPVRASDFVYAFDRIALKKNASELAYTLEHISGFRDVNKLGRESHLEGLKAPRARRLVIELTEPFQDLPALLTHPALVPLDRSAVAKSTRFLRAPTGNGPFKMAEPWVPGQPVVLKSFERFMQAPKLDGIRFVPYRSASTSWLQFVRGQLDVAEVPLGQFDAAAEHFSRRGFHRLLTGYYYGFNLRSKPLRDLRLRKAVSLAIDRARIGREVLEGTLEPPRGIVPAGVPGFDENICSSLCTYSPTRARALVQKVPSKARRLTLQFPAGEPHDAIARAVRRDLSAVGLDVRLQALQLPRYLKLLRDGKQSLYRLGWIAEYPLADVFLSPLFRSTSPENHSGFKSRRVDRLLSAAHRRPSQAARRKLYLKAEGLIMQRVPIVPIGSFLSHWAVQPTVKGVVFDGLGGFDAAGVSLGEEE